MTKLTLHLEHRAVLAVAGLVSFLGVGSAGYVASAAPSTSTDCTTSPATVDGRVQLVVRGKVVRTLSEFVTAYTNQRGTGTPAARVHTGSHGSYYVTVPAGTYYLFIDRSAHGPHISSFTRLQLEPSEVKLVDLNSYAP